MARRMMMLVLLALAGVTVFCAAKNTFGQEAENPTKAQAADSIAPVAYRMDYLLNELEDGKKINTRQYSMNLNLGDANAIKIGSRVPVDTKQGEFQYLDVGTNIWNRLRERGGSLTLEVRAEVSSIATEQSGTYHPVVRQVQINASTVVIPGKPMIVGTVDDPNSRRQFQLEVTVARLK